MILRPITINDSEFLQDMSGTPSDAQFPTQKDWIMFQLKRTNIEMFIAEENGEDIAWLEIDHLDAEDELRWVVHPKFRNKGFGKKVVGMLIEKSHSPHVFATIRSDNLPSLRIAQSLGIEIRQK